MHGHPPDPRLREQAKAVLALAAVACPAIAAWMFWQQLPALAFTIPGVLLLLAVSYAWLELSGRLSSSRRLRTVTDLARGRSEGVVRWRTRSPWGFVLFALCVSQAAVLVWAGAAAGLPILWAIAAVPALLGYLVALPLFNTYTLVVQGHSVRVRPSPLWEPGARAKAAELPHGGCVCASEHASPRGGFRHTLELRRPDGEPLVLTRVRSLEVATPLCAAMNELLRQRGLWRASSDAP